MSDARVEVLPVPEGSIIWMHNTLFDEEGTVSPFIEQLHQAIGHNRFLVISTMGDGDIKVFGSSEEAVKAVSEALAP